MFGKLKLSLDIGTVQMMGSIDRDNDSDLRRTAYIFKEIVFIFS